MVNYKDGKIYAIRSYQTDMLYIGSTTQSLAKRLGGHRIGFKNRSTYCSSYEVIKFEDHFIELIEAFPCNNRDELRRREGQLIREYENTVNRLVAGRTPKEYYQESKQII